MVPGFDPDPAIQGARAGNIKFDKFDFILCVFVNEENFKIESIYKVPHDTVRKHTKPYHSFRWNKKSKSDKTIGKIYPS